MNEYIYYKEEFLKWQTNYLKFISSMEDVLYMYAFNIFTEVTKMIDEGRSFTQFNIEEEAELAIKTISKKLPTLSNEIRSIIVKLLDRETIFNEPLSLEKLKSFDGHAVYLECSSYNGWVIVTMNEEEEGFYFTGAQGIVVFRQFYDLNKNGDWGFSTFLEAPLYDEKELKILIDEYSNSTENA